MLTKNKKHEKDRRYSDYSWNALFKLTHIDIVYLKAFERGYTNRAISLFFNVRQDWVKKRAAVLRANLGFSSRKELVSCLRWRNEFKNLDMRYFERVLTDAMGKASARLAEEEREVYEGRASTFVKMLIR